MTFYDKVVIMQRIIRKIVSLIMLSAISILMIPIVAVGYFSLWLGEWNNKGSLFNVNR